MNSKFINVLVFAAGAAIGSAVTWKIVKTRYERLIQEEIESVREVFANRVDDTPDVENDEHTHVGQISMSDLEDLYDNEDDDHNDYTRLVEQYTNKKGGAEDMTDKVTKAPYVISPYDFGELDDYSQVELTYYSDGTIEDEDYNVVSDVDELIGGDALNTFGEYEEDAVFVRNERLRTDFQILKDYRTYTEARSIGPNKGA